MSNPWGYRPVETFTQTYPGQPWNETFYMQRRRCYQKAPFNLALPYSLDYATYQPGEPADLGGARHDAISLCGAYYNSSIVTLMANKSYENFRGKIYEKVQLGVDFVELRKSYTMIVSAASSLVNFTLAVKKFQFGKAAKALHMRGVPKGVSQKKNWSSNWLEYIYGWKPLITTIYDASEIAVNPVKSYRARASAQSQTDFGSWNENNGSTNPFGSWWSHYSYSQGGEVRSVDANSFTLSQLGLNNPASIAWELIPFSFVVDWFLNVGQMLESLTDFQGMTLENTYSTLFYRNGESGQVRANPGYSGKTRFFTGASLQLRRSQGLTKPAFAIKRIALPSKTRALTAVALLNEVFGH
jgi:hypothetical protein